MASWHDNIIIIIIIVISSFPGDIKGAGEHRGLFLKPKEYITGTW